MSIRSDRNAPRIEQLKTHLRTERYTPWVQRRYTWVAQRFLDYLESKTLAIETVRAAELEDFLRWELRRFRDRHGRAPRHLGRWRSRYTSAVHMVLRLVHGHWPLLAAPATALEAFHRELVCEYDTWMRNLRGLAAVTRSKRAVQALHFLTALGPRADQKAITHLEVRDVDAYVQPHCAGLRRSSIEDRTGGLRAFLRYLHNSGRTAIDLSRTVIGPRIYDYEHIPSALRAEEVEKVLEITRQDLSPTGRRDYAILMLLATYGLRAGEIVAIRLEDIDWRNEVLRVRHSKTRTYSELPLLHPPGEAVLSYLEKARPKSVHREVFLLAQAPYRAFKKGAFINGVIAARLRRAGIVAAGRKGPHAFRHARAVSLLRAEVPLKTIGDVLGHKSTHSTAVYLKLATEDLRAVGLNVPREVSP
jgi:integrase/recombinase XerD